MELSPLKVALDGSRSKLAFSGLLQHLAQLDVQHLVRQVLGAMEGKEEMGRKSSEWEGQAQRQR